MKNECPNCGNKDHRLIQSNGEKESSLDLTLLCVARVPANEWSFAGTATPAKEDYDADGLVPCGMQWEPNQ